MITRNRLMYVLIISFVVIIAVIFIISAQEQDKNRNFAGEETIIYVDSDYKVYKGVEGLEQEADLIVEVEATSDINYINQSFDEGIPLFYWTETKVQVNQTYKGDPAREIIIYEPYSIFHDKEGLENIIIDKDYEKMIPGQRYLMFLKYHKDGGYMPLGVYQGKVHLDKKENTNNHLAQQARKKYGYNNLPE